MSDSDADIDLVLEHLSSDGAQKWQNTLGEVVDVLAAAYARAGHGPEESRKLAAQGGMALATHLGGQVVYLPKADKTRRFIRDRQIFDEYGRGASIQSLIQRYRLTHAAIYEILAEQRRLYAARVQPDLFSQE